MNLRKNQQRKKGNLNGYENPLGHVVALNWGFWQQGTTSPTPNKYPKSAQGLATDHKEVYYNPDFAEICEAIICKCCNKRDKLALTAYYIRELDTNQAASLLTKQGYSCDRKKFAVFLEQARAKLEAVYMGFWSDCDRLLEEID